MPVDFSKILHVLAHELRTPLGIAHGYVRLLLEDRLPQESDRRRALDQMQKALGRLTELSHECTGLAAWLERDGGRDQTIHARSLLERLTNSEYAKPLAFEASDVDADALIRTMDATALTQALVTMVRATMRELGGLDCAVIASTDGGDQLQLLAGRSDQLPALGTGPDVEAAGAIALERGGLGLALVHAYAVLGAHGARCWTLNRSRQVLGIRIPLEERPLP
jgi:signal transduction histidine kinase